MSYGTVLIGMVGLKQKRSKVLFPKNMLSSQIFTVVNKEDDYSLF